MRLAPLLTNTLDARTAALARAALDPGDDSRDPAQREAWEQRFARWLGVADGGTVAAWGSGRASLLAVVRALGLGAGDTVIVPAFTCRSVTQAIRQAGAAVQFADIETDAFGLDASSVHAAIGPATRALLVQHSFGLVGRDLEALLALARERGLLVIEDCAHAMGSSWRGQRLGALGDAAIFSFERGKVLSTVHGGMAVVRGEAAGERLRRAAAAAPTADEAELRRLLASIEHDWRTLGADAQEPEPAALPAVPADLAPRMWPEELDGRICPQYEQRLAPALAALAQAQFDRLDAVLARRRQQAGAWQRVADAAGWRGAVVRADSSPCWLRFPFWVDPAVKAAPQALARQLGVDIGVWFTTPEHPVPSPQLHCPRGLRACAEVVNLPTLLPAWHPSAAAAPPAGER